MRMERGCGWKTKFGSMYLLTIVSVAAMLTSCQPRADLPDPISLMSFNLRYSGADDGENSWPFRKALLLKTIERRRPAVLGVQEAMPDQIEYLAAGLHGYEYVGRGREADGSGEWCAIYHDTTRLERLDAGYFWLSGTPDVPGSNDWGNACVRLATWGRYQLRESDQSALIINTHFDHRNAKGRVKSAELVAGMVDSLRRAGETVAVMGDFNCRYGNVPWKILAGDSAGATSVRMVDTWLAAGTQVPDSATFHGFTGKGRSGRIDWILVDANTEVREAEIIQDHENGRYPSDHFPVTALVQPRP